jgi:hypothetical protein
MDLQQLASKDLYTQNRYLMLVAKSIPAGSWIWFNGNQGCDYAILNNQVSASYGEALEQLASNNDESIESVEADYKDWYYKVPIEEVIKDYQHNINYYSPLVTA